MIWKIGPYAPRKHDRWIGLAVLAAYHAALFGIGLLFGAFLI